MHGVLPLKAILFKRHIGTSDICPLCNVEPEDSLHMLFKCPGAANIWSEIGLQNMLNNYMMSGTSGAKVLESLLKSNAQNLPGYESIKTHEVIVVMASYIWWLHRRLTHDEQIPPVYQCINSIIKAITANVAKGKSRSSSHKITWSKPLASAVKLNIDAAFDVERKSGASGAIIRNNQGNFIAASSVFIPYVASATMRGNGNVTWAEFC
jgi:hypothetical protein